MRAVRGVWLIIQVVTVTVAVNAPKQVTLMAGQSHQFGALVTGTNDTSVVRSINPVLGSITGDGTYTAPVFIANPQKVTVTATSVADPTKSDSATVMLASPPTISAATLPPGEIAFPYSATLSASGGTSPYANWIVSAGSLPPGLSLNPTTGIINGTPKYRRYLQLLRNGQRQ